MGSCLSASREGPRVSRRKERRRQAMEILMAEAQSSELLLRIPTRMCSNGATAMACVFTQQGRKGTNQDAMLVWEDFASRTDTVFCGVFDGHGPFGHLVARKVRDSLPSKLASNWKAHLRGDADGDPEGAGGAGAYSSLEEEWREETGLGMGESPEAFEAWKQSFLKSFRAMDKELRTHPAIDCFCSGTTAVTLLLQGGDLVIGNVGDSRAVLATRVAPDNSLQAVQLTVDLKPNLPKEAERIKKCKGRVFALQDEPEVARVWLPYDDSPGLAMARAFGDFCLKDFGLIAVPDISYRRISNNDEFVVLATDGVWDVLSNQEAVDVVSSAPTRSTAARALVETAVRAWRLKYPTSKIDDCAAVCLYLHHSNPAASPQEAPVVTSSFDSPNLAEEAACNSGEAAGVELDRSNTVRSSIDSELHARTVDLPLEISKEKAIDRSSSRRSLADCLSVGDGNEEWSALDGVTRVNSLLNLPRFLVGGDKKSGGGTRRRR